MDGAGAVEEPSSAVPHSPQNLARGLLAAWQTGHRTARSEPHSRQNFRPGSFSVPHDEQRTRPPAFPK